MEQEELCLLALRNAGESMMLRDNNPAVIVRSTSDLRRKVEAKRVASQAHWDHLAAFSSNMARSISLPHRCCWRYCGHGR
ncbi:hypothetical protein KTQ42_18855 [Noviherbaspirillum sp. L7-7A]|uniref:hypothetical protein n=1 Tax=Noviherbaspirillum sp. L7-7A TaxID=2850560 RepID=UPI001C2BACEA|nr:hypothetical protein [Noviherbaspirillum sp. L7-7A]MBV0881355.1 hypothetical protein [Noviherbaspirillum sp. L7-7A]